MPVHPALGLTACASTGVHTGVPNLELGGPEEAHLHLPTRVAAWCPALHTKWPKWHTGTANSSHVPMHKGGHCTITDEAGLAFCCFWP